MNMCVFFFKCVCAAHLLTVYLTHSFMFEKLTVFLFLSCPQTPSSSLPTPDLLSYIMFLLSLYMR